MLMKDEPVREKLLMDGMSVFLINYFETSSCLLSLSIYFIPGLPFMTFSLQCNILVTNVHSEIFNFHGLEMTFLFSW
jgi:hypothetical protein